MLLDYYTELQISSIIEVILLYIGCKEAKSKFYFTFPGGKVN